jgi:predicted extracellular nuclease
LPALALTLLAATLRIGAWNIEHLGNPSSRGSECVAAPHRCAQSPEDLADYIIASGVAVLGLEEISEDLPGGRNATVEHALLIIRQRTGQTWSHVLFPKADEHQHIGVAWNTARVRMVGEPLRLPVRTKVSSESLWDRRPHAVKFSTGAGRTDFVVIVLHMKANRQERNGPNVRRRELEARELVRVLPRVRDDLDDGDVLLIGDTNILHASEGAPRVFVEAGLRDLNTEDEATFLSREGAPFDRAFVAGDQPELAGVDQVVFRPPGLSRQAFRKRLSDHYMIVTEIRVVSDDD